MQEGLERAEKVEQRVELAQLYSVAFQNKAGLERTLKKYGQAIDSFKYAVAIAEHMLGHHSALFRKLQAQKLEFIRLVKQDEESSIRRHEDLKDDRKAYQYFKPLELSVKRLKQLSALIPDQARNSLVKEQGDEIDDQSPSPAEAPQKAEMGNMMGDVLSLL